MKNGKPEIVLKRTGVPKQYYVDNGFYTNRFQLKDVYEPEAYYHVPSVSSRNEFVYEPPAQVDVFPCNELPDAIDNEFATTEENIADKYINEARNFAQKELLEVEEFKEDIEAQNKMNELFCGTDYEQKTRDLLQDKLTTQFDKNAEAVTAKYTNLGIDNFTFPDESDVLHATSKSFVEPATEQLETVVERTPQAPSQRTMQTEILEQRNPFYAPSQPVPDYIKELTAEYYNGAMMLEEAHNREFRLQEATHFAAMLQAERNTNRYLESGATKTVNGLLERVQELESELIESKTFEKKEKMVDDILKKRVDELRKSGLCESTAPLIESEQAQPAKVEVKNEADRLSPLQAQNQMLMQQNLMLEREMQQINGNMEQYKHIIEQLSEEQQKENSITQTQNIESSSETSSSPAPQTPVHPLERHVKKTPLQRQGSLQDMRNISPQNLLVAPTVQVVKQLTIEQQDKSMTEKLSKSMSPPAKTQPILPARKTKIAAELVRANVEIEEPKLLGADANVVFQKAVSKLVDAKKNNIIAAMRSSRNSASDSLQIEISDDTVKANEEWQDDTLKAEHENQERPEQPQAEHASKSASEELSEEDFDLDIEV